MLRSPQAVSEHYAGRALGDAILAALKAAGKDLEHLTPDDLAPIDEFHNGQRNATIRLARFAAVSGSDKVLDVGCGIGGPSRYLASAFGCEVIGLDLTPEFIELAHAYQTHEAQPQSQLQAGGCAAVAVSRCELRSRVVAKCDNEHCGSRAPLRRDAARAQGWRPRGGFGHRPRSRRGGGLFLAVGPPTKQ